MDTKYKNIFNDIAQAVISLSSQVIETEKQSKNFHTGQIMKDDFKKLYARMNALNFEEENFSRADYAKLLVGTVIIIQNLEQKIANEKFALDGYKSNLLPKLKQLLDNSKTDEEARKIASEIFRT